MNLEDIMQSETSLIQKNNTSKLPWSHLNVESKKIEFIEAESRQVVTGWGDVGPRAQSWGYVKWGSLAG